MISLNSLGAFDISVSLIYTVLMVYDYYNCAFYCFWLNHYLDIESYGFQSTALSDSF